MPVPIVNQVEQRILRDLFGIERTVVRAGRASVDDGASRETDTDTRTRSVHHTPTKNVVDREKWAALKGKIGLSSAELVRLNAYVGLLMKSKEILEQKCTELYSLLMTWRRQRTGAVDSRTPSVFAASLTDVH